MSRAQDINDPRRFSYRFAKKGIDLAPVLVDMVIWSATYVQTDAPPDGVRSMRVDREGFLAQVRDIGKTSGPKCRWRKQAS